MRATTQRRIVLGGNCVDYDVVVSKAARQFRLRVGPGGVEVIQPVGVGEEETSAFLRRNESWVLAQLERVSSLRALRRPARRQPGEILYRGESTQVRVEVAETKARGNLVQWSEGEIIVRRGLETRTPAARGLESWLRQQARSAIVDCLPELTARIRQRPGPGLRDGPTNEVGQLLVAREPVVQLAPRPCARFRASLPRHSRSRASGCPGPLRQVLAHGAKPLSRDGASETVAEPTPRAAYGEPCQHRGLRLRLGMVCSHDA